MLLIKFGPFVLLSLLALASSVQSMSLSISPAQTAAWRKQIFEQLSERSKREMDHFKHYEQAIEQVPTTNVYKCFLWLLAFV